MIKRALNLVTFAAVLLVVGCEKKNDDEKSSVKCRMAKSVVYDGANASDSFTYRFNNDNTVSRVETNGGAYYTLEYDGAKIISRTFYAAGNPQPIAKETISYLPNGTISSIERRNATTNTDLVSKTNFTYNANKLTGITIEDAEARPLATYSYSYTINNVTRLDAMERWNGTTAENYTMLFTYDTSPNFFHSGQQSLLSDGFFSSQMPVAMPYALSDNNVKEIELGGIKIPITYSQDANGNVTEVRTGTSLLMRGSYECQ